MQPTFITKQPTLISSIHGRDRRNLRNIEKHSLKDAVKYGKREKGAHGNLKFTFKNIVYITDPTGRYEVTSWVLPLVISPIDLPEQEYQNHKKLKSQLRDNPDKCSSHSVICIDQSGSMKVRFINQGMRR